MIGLVTFSDQAQALLGNADLTMLLRIKAAP
jgi:hypothetical protein